MTAESFCYVEKLWEGVDAVMDRCKDGKKTYQELKSRIESVVSLEKDNSSNILSFSKRFQPFVETGSITTIYASLADLFTQMAGSFKSIADKTSLVPNQLASELELYETTFKKNADDLPGIRKKKEKLVDNAQQLRKKYIVAFREWDKVEEDYTEMSKDTKTPVKKVDKERKRTEEKKDVRDKAWNRYSDAVKECQKAEEAYNAQMNTFLSTCQKADQKRLKTVAKTLSDTCLLYEECFQTYLTGLSKIRTELDQLDPEKEEDEFANAKNTRRVPQPLTVTVEELRRNESKNVVTKPSPSSGGGGGGGSGSSGGGGGGGGKPFITVQHPLIIYATYDYKPTFPPYNPSKPNLDKDNKPLPQNYSDIALKGNNPYLLTAVDYPWDGWCGVTSLVYKDDSQSQVFEGDSKGCAPVNYFNSENFEYAKTHLQSNPDAASGAFQITALIGGGARKSMALKSSLPLQSGGSVPPPPPLNAGGGGGGGGGKKTYTVLYAYKDEEGTLSVNVGDTLFLPPNHTPEGASEEWILVETKAGQQGYIPANYIQRNF